MVKLVEEVAAEAAEGGAGEEGGDEKSGGDGDAVDEGRQANVRHEEEEQRGRREGARVVLPRLPEVEQLLDGVVGVSED